MASSERALQGLTFPLQYLEIGESLARALGHDVHSLDRHCGLTLPRPFLPWQTMAGRHLQRSLGYLLMHCPPGEPPLVTFMAHFPVTVHGPVGMLAITSATLDEALQGALTYAPLVMPAFGMRRQDFGDEVHILFERLHDFGEVNDFFTETVVASFLKIMPFLTRPLQGAEVHLQHAPQGPQAAYEQAFGCSFHFGARQNKIVLARQDLGIALMAPSRASHLLMKATLEHQLKARLDVRPVTQEVKRLLHAAMRQRQQLDADGLAQCMAMSARTLSRRLKDEGSTLPQLRCQVGVEHAEVLLIETRKPMAQVARAAGFADTASFSRAFKRLTGQTPTALREGSGPAALHPAAAPAQDQTAALRGGSDSAGAGLAAPGTAVPWAAA